MLAKFEFAKTRIGERCWHQSRLDQGLRESYLVLARWYVLCYTEVADSGDTNLGHGQIPLKVPNIEFNLDVKFLMYALSTACCQQIQIHQKCIILICTQ